MARTSAEVVILPVRDRQGEPVRNAVWQLESNQLLAAAGNLVRLADDAAEQEDDENFYDRVRAAYLCLERILIEQMTH